MITGRVNSLQSLGTLDGPGVRFVVFMQGCNLRCGCCHNPETQPLVGGTEYTPQELLKSVLRYREYFGADGGITVSGGEPLLQADFVGKLFEICRENGINTCLDTSGSILNSGVLKLLECTDRVLLDIKYTDEELYRKHVGCGYNAPLKFLRELEKRNIPTTLRQVIIPTLNDNEENILRLRKIAKTHTCVDKTELLPFKKICAVKYENMGLRFPFSYIPVPTAENMKTLEGILSNN